MKDRVDRAALLALVEQARAATVEQARALQRLFLVLEETADPPAPADPVPGPFGPVPVSPGPLVPGGAMDWSAMERLQPGEGLAYPQRYDARVRTHASRLRTRLGYDLVTRRTPGEPYTFVYRLED